MRRSIALDALPERFGIARLPAGTPRPEWSRRGEFTATVETGDEFSVVCLDAAIPDGVAAEHDYVCFRVRGPLDFDEVGILAALTYVLSEANISVFVVASYDTDYLLVRACDRDRAVDALRRAGHDVATASQSE